MQIKFSRRWGPTYKSYTNISQFQIKSSFKLSCKCVHVTNYKLKINGTFGYYASRYFRDEIKPILGTLQYLSSSVLLILLYSCLSTLWHARRDNHVTIIVGKYLWMNCTAAFYNALYLLLVTIVYTNNLLRKLCNSTLMQ